MVIVEIIISVLIAQLAGGLGSLFTTPSIPTWYAGLVKPFFQPPNWLFAPVWTTLFTLMGVASYLIWRERKKKKAVRLLQVYAVHLVFNTIWSILFFGLKNLGLAFAEILILWGMILYLMINFYRLNKWAGIMLVPYLAWVTFASILNLTIWMLN